MIGPRISSSNKIYLVFVKRFPSNVTHEHVIVLYPRHQRTDRQRGKYCFKIIDSRIIFHRFSCRFIS